jgi:hypothetical protein
MTALEEGDSGRPRPAGSERRQPKSATGVQRLAEDTMSAFRIALLIVCLCGSPLFADWTYEVTGGKDEAQSALVSLPLPAKTQVPEAVSVTGPDGKPFKAQVIPAGAPGLDPGQAQVMVLVSDVKPGQSIRLLVKPVARTNPEKGQGLEWKMADSHPAELWRHEKGKDVRVLSFVGNRFDPNATPPGKQALQNPTIKPYHHVFDPATGTVQLTNGPVGQYPHHRGIFYGFNKISYGGQSADTWHCRGGEGTVAGDPQIAETGALFALHRLPVTWNGQDGKAFAEEIRQLLVSPGPQGIQIDFSSELRTSLASGVKLDGDPQHAGFHFRASAAMEKNTKQTYFLRPEGKGNLGEERNWDPKTKKGPVNLPWDAMCFELEGKRYSVLYLDHPNNPKEARQSERCYGRIGTYFVYELTPQKPLVVHYRLWIQEGELTTEQCEAMSRAFTQQAKVVAK